MLKHLQKFIFCRKKICSKKPSTEKNVQNSRHHIFFVGRLSRRCQMVSPYQKWGPDSLFKVGLQEIASGGQKEGQQPVEAKAGGGYGSLKQFHFLNLSYMDK